MKQNILLIGLFAIVLCVPCTRADKIHFEVNPDGAEQAKVKISSKLMKLARIFKK